MPCERDREPINSKPLLYQDLVTANIQQIKKADFVFKNFEHHYVNI